jgi:tol-pal system protein YbgF
MKTVKSRLGRAAALAVALLSSAGCATKRDLRDLRSELQALGARQDTILMVLARQSLITQDSLRRQTNQLFEIRGDVSRQLQRILDELTTLRELTGQNQRTMAALRDRVEGMRQGGGGGEPGAGEAIVGVQPGTDSGDPEGVYAAAFDQYQRGSLTTAQRAFQAFVEQFGNHERAPDARFYLADILEQQKKPQDAVDAFNKISELHPASTRVPDALYRAALLLAELGKRDEARRNLERVVNTYPESNSAGPARQKLRELR